MRLGKVEQNGEVKANPWWVVLLAALIGAGGSLVNAGVDWLLKPEAQQATIELEKSKLELERQKALTTLYQAALANSDAGQRELLVKFLVKARIVDQALEKIPREEIPHWPPTARNP